MTDQRVAAVQAVVVATINAMGEVLIGDGFTRIESSPIPDSEVADMLAVVLP